MNRILYIQVTIRTQDTIHTSHNTHIGYCHNTHTGYYTYKSQLTTHTQDTIHTSHNRIRTHTSHNTYNIQNNTNNTSCIYKSHYIQYIIHTGYTTLIH
ncbi:unnamed protein product [Rhizophagus irregularis]|nr:unnamed protein product [Rhizophagus irregularis]